MASVTYEQLISDVAKGVEAVGATIMVGGGLLALGDYAASCCNQRHGETGTGGYAGA